jgi:long-chain acyl-CoA synthetase
MAIHSSFSWGLTVHLVDPHNMKNLVRIINTKSPEIIFGVPAQYSFCVRNKIQSSESIYFSGTAPLPFNLVTRFEEKVGVPIIDGYGATESSGASTLNISALARTLGYNVPLRPGIGVPLPDTDLKLTNSSNYHIENNLSQLNEKEKLTGEFWIRGPQIMYGYWTSDRMIPFSHEWISMGDVVSIDREGYIQIVDRKKDMINVSGNKVYSKLVEEILRLHPAIQNVAIIGLPHPTRTGQEQVKAVIQIEDSWNKPLRLQEIQRFLKDKVKYYALPKVIEIVDNLPRTNLLKMDKTQLQN